MAAHGTVWYEVLKFGPLTVDSPLSLLIKFHVCTLGALVSPMGQMWRCIYAYNF